MKQLYIVRHTTGPITLAERIAYLAQEQLPEIDVRLVSAQRQKSLLALMPSIVEKIPAELNLLNLDPFTRLPYHQTLDICRVFEPGKQERCIGHDARPGSAPLTVQLQQLKPGNYHLLDDDISTGSTMKFVEQLLQSARPDVRVVGSMSLLEISMHEAGLADRKVYDVIDSHDFVEAKRKTAQSGLVMKLNGRLQRMTYITPMVNLETRARLPNPQAFIASLKAEVKVPYGWGFDRWLKAPKQKALA